MHFIKRKVNELVKRFNSNDPFEIAEGLNIIVLFEDLGKTLGYYSLINDINLFILTTGSMKRYIGLFVVMN